MKSKIPSLVTVLVLTLITSLMWIGFTVYRAVTEKPDPSVPGEIVEDVNPVLNRTSIESLKSKIFLTEGEIPQTQFASSPTPTPQASPTPIASTTPEASPTSTSTSTASSTPTSTAGATQTP